MKDEVERRGRKRELEEYIVRIRREEAAKRRG
jgi:hypothetical protein